MPLGLLIVGIALLLIAALGPRFGLRRAATLPKQDHRHATVLILRILAGLLGLWLVFFSAVNLLHGHGHLLPSATHDVR